MAVYTEDDLLRFVGLKDFVSSEDLKHSFYEPDFEYKELYHKLSILETKGYIKTIGQPSAFFQAYKITEEGKNKLKRNEEIEETNYEKLKLDNEKSKLEHEKLIPEIQLLKEKVKDYPVTRIIAYISIAVSRECSIKCVISLFHCFLGGSLRGAWRP
jgi:ERCC4-related helicase